MEKATLACFTIILCLCGQVAEVPLWAQEIVWQRKHDGGSDDYVHGIAVDSQGNVHVTGYSFNDANFDCLTVEYDSDGKLLWEKRYDGGGNDAGYGVAVDAEGNVYVTGFSSNGANDDYLTIKYNSDGAILWQKKYDSGGEDWASAVAVDSQGNACVTGTSCNAPTQDWVTIKYDSNAKELWRKRYDSKANDWSRGVAVDAQGNAYVTGISGGKDKTVKYNSNGDIAWQKSAGFNGHGAFAVTVDSEGNVYVTGEWNNPVRYDADLTLVKYKSNGDMVWKKNSDAPGNDLGYGVSVGAQGNVYIVGQRWAAFLVKYNSNGDIVQQEKPLPFVQRPHGIVCDLEGNVYVGGFSHNGSNYDYAVGKLRQQQEKQQ